MIIKFLNWIISLNSNTPNWRNPLLLIGSVGAWLVLMGIPTSAHNLYIGLSMLIIGALIWVLLILAMMNIEYEQFGKHRWIKKKLF